MKKIGNFIRLIFNNLFGISVEKKIDTFKLMERREIGFPFLFEPLYDDFSICIRHWVATGTVSYEKAGFDLEVYSKAIECISRLDSFGYTEEAKTMMLFPNGNIMKHRAIFRDVVSDYVVNSNWDATVFEDNEKAKQANQSSQQSSQIILRGVTEI